MLSPGRHSFQVGVMTNPILVRMFRSILPSAGGVIRARDAAAPRYVRGEVESLAFAAVGGRAGHGPDRSTSTSAAVGEVAIKAAQENAGSGPLTAHRANAPFYGPIPTRGRLREPIYAAALNARSSQRQPLGDTRTRRTCRLSQPHRKGAPGGHPREGSDIVHSEDQPAHTPPHGPPASGGRRWVREG